MSEAPASDTPFLSVDQAMGLLNAPDAVEPDETVAVDDAPSEAEPTADDDLDPELVIEDDAADEPDPETPAIAAPQSWDAEARAVFATLSPEAQQVIVARDSEANKAVSRAQTESAEVRKKAEAEVQSVTQLRVATEQVLTRVAQNIKGKWDNVDWSAWAQSDPAAYVAGKAQFDADQAQLASLEETHQKQLAVEMQAFMASKAEKIKTEAPDLVDPEKGPARIQRLEKFLEANGIPRDIFHTLDAFTIGLANDGFKYRELLAKSKAKTATPEPSRAAVRPAAASQVRSPQRAAEAVQTRFRQTRSIDDAVAALDARK